MVILRLASSKFQADIEKLQIKSDFDYFISIIESDQLRLEPIDESKLSETAKKVGILDISNYKDKLDSKFNSQIIEIQNRENWLDFSLFMPNDQNLSERYQRAFNQFKSKFGKIIHDIHVKLASARAATDVKKEDWIISFVKDTYCIDLKKN